MDKILLETSTVPLSQAYCETMAKKQEKEQTGARNKKKGEKNDDG